MVTIIGCVARAKPGLVDLLTGEEPRMIELAPSLGALDFIDALPSGSTIGIETMSDEDRVRFEADSAALGQEFGLTAEVPDTPNYWSLVSRQAAEAGHTIVPLKSADLLAESTRYLLGAQALRRELRRSESSSSPVDRVGLFWDMFKKDTLYHQVLTVDRPRMMAERALDAQCDVLWLSLGNAQVVAPYAKDLGMDVDAYFTDLPEWGTTNYFTPKDRLESGWGTEKQRRLHRVAMGWNLTDDSPDFVGTWDSNSVEGYFEIYIEGTEDGETVGRMVDMLGEARVVGTISPDLAYFRKDYDSANSSKRAASGSVVFSGSGSSEGLISGRFHTDNWSGQFMMTERPRLNPTLFTLYQLLGSNNDS